MHNLGHTRSTNKRDHLLLTPDTFIRTPLPGLSGGFAVVHVAPQAGAAFTQMTVELDAGGTLSEGPTQRLLYVLEGQLQLDSGGLHELLDAGDCAYVESDMALAWSSAGKSRCRVLAVAAS